MKNKWIMKAGVAAALIGFSTMVQATPITGDVNFEGGTATWNATQILSFGGTTIVANDPGSLPTGTYIGTQNTVATFTPFVFSPSFVPNNPVWTFNYGGDTFSFNLTSESVIVNQPNSLLIQGLGTLFFKQPLEAIILMIPQWEPLLSPQRAKELRSVSPQAIILIYLTAERL